MRASTFGCCTKVAAFDGRSLALDSASDAATPLPLAARTLIWTAGVGPSPLIESLSLAKERGRIAVDDTMAVPGHEGVWACGDCAAVPGPLGKPYPTTAQHAMRQGVQAARNVAAVVRGRAAQIRPFRYEMLGQFAAIGRHRAVATLFGRRFSGFIAWLMWRGAYLSMLPRLDRKVRVFLQWTLEIFSRATRGAAAHRGEHARRPHRRADEQCPRRGIRGPRAAAMTDAWSLRHCCQGADPHASPHAQHAMYARPSSGRPRVRDDEPRVR